VEERRGRALLLNPDVVSAGTPILCFLHGIGQSADNRRLGDPETVPQQLMLSATINLYRGVGERVILWFTRFIIVCPQLESRRASDPTVHAPVVLQLIAVGHVAGIPAVLLESSEGWRQFHGSSACSSWPFIHVSRGGGTQAGAER
jgi:hypothetical protein